MNLIDIRLQVTSNCAVFVFIGAWIDFPSMNMPELHVTPGRLAAFFFSILFVRRIPPMLLLYRVVPDIRTWKEALFVGWFGPMGIVRYSIISYLDSKFGLIR